ncbi:hypothetical protein Btru_073434 [Bulinus truncatus]|nr:hypothetical protein Btru_073434 [Bulinus truncatus]
MSEHNVERSESIDNTCPVCHDVFEIFAIGPCDHPVCYRCSTRMRVLCDQMDCPICRSPMPQVAFVYKKILFKNINLRNCIPNRKFKIFFEDEKIEGCYLDLLELRCKICRKRDPDKSFNQLQTHMRREHQLFACELCVTHLKIFPFQRKFYTRQTLAVHRRMGDEDDKSYKGHPLCEFCDTRYNDKDELWKHLRKDHFFCHFCDQRGSNEFYDQYPDLMKHFSESHFLCSEDDCANSSTRFTHAFASEIDLKAHKASVHGKNMSKAQSREARTIELDFQLPPRRQGNNRGNDYDSGRNYERSNRRRDRDYDDDLHRAIEASKESATNSQAKPAAEERVPDSVHDFPSLNGATVPVLSVAHNYFNRPKIQEEDFPTLSSSAANKQQNQAPVKQYSSVMNPPVDKKPPPVVKAESKPVSLGSVSKTFRPQAAPKMTEDEYPALGGGGNTVPNGKSSPASNSSAGWIKKGGSQSKTSPVTVSSPVVRSAPPTRTTMKDDNEFPTLETSGPRKNHIFVQSLKSKPKQENLEKMQKSKKIDDESFELPDSYYSSFDDLKQKPVENEAELVIEVPKQTMPSSLNDFPDLPARSSKTVNSGNEQKKKKKPKKEKTTTKVTPQFAQETNASLNDIALALVSGKTVNKPSKPTDWFDNPPISIEPLNEMTRNTAVLSTSTEKPINSENGSYESKGKLSNLDIASTDSEEKTSYFDKEDKASPGFTETLLTKLNSTVSAPPGFRPAPCPPPGFNVSYIYIQPAGFTERNSNLVKQIRESLSGIEEGFSNFKALSGQFRQGGMDASDYYNNCLTLMGDENFECIFPELLALLPDISKQQELWEVHGTAAGKTARSKNFSRRKEDLKGTQLSQCQTCGQVLLKRDLLDHHSQHNNLAEFPSLSGLSGLSKVICK